MREQLNVEPHPDEVFRATSDIRGGVACFTGTRVGVSQLLGYLRDGYTIDDFPTVTKDQAQRAIERIDKEYVRVIERGRRSRASADARYGHRGRRVHGVERPG